jgi:Ca-activated chloride channel homolog
MFPWPARQKRRDRLPARAAISSRRLIFAASLALPAAFLFAQDVPVFRSNVNLVRLTATVKTKTGALVGSLGKDDFEIYDNGARQEIVHFERQTNQPLSVSLMVDVSGSTAKDLGYEIESAGKFLHALLAEGNPDDRAALYTFDDSVRVDQGFTRSSGALNLALKKIHGTAGTSLYDAIYLVARELEPRQGRKVMVIVSDGGETTSHYGSHDALEAAQLADSVVYSVVVKPITSDAGRNRGGESFLEWIATGTGGKAFTPELNAQLDKAFTAIIGDLRTQYSLGFYPHDVPLTKDRWHKLEIREKSGKLQVFARNRYYGDAENSSSGVPDPGNSVNADVRSKKKR